MRSSNHVHLVIPHDANEGVLGALWDDIFPPDLLAELYAHPFLATCREGKAGSELLRAFLVQHHYYSQYFTRYLCAMMASLPNQSDVKALADNLFEEMGLDREGSETHAELYLKSMAAAGAKAGSQPMLAQTRLLTDAMFRYCRSVEPLDGLAALCLGGEAIVPVVYGAVLSGMQQAGVSAEGLEFFRIHVEEDEGHAIVMRKIIDQLLDAHPYRRNKVIAIGEDMVRLRMAMLGAILAQHQELAA